MRNGHERVIVCNRVPIFQDESDLDLFPHAAKGIVYLTAAGSVDWIDAEKFGMDDPPHVVLGPESNLEMFHPIKPDYDQ